MKMLLDALDETGVLHVGGDPRACFEAVESTIGFRHVVIKFRPAIEDVDHLEVVAAADLEIVEIVCPA